MIHFRTRMTLAAACMALATLITPAFAGLPAIYDRIPAEAVVVITTKNLGDVDHAFSELRDAIDLPAMATPTELLGNIGLGEAIDLTRPAAVALMPGDLEADMPPAVLLLPTTDFAAMMDALGGVEDDGIYQIEIETGEKLYARAGDSGYAVIGPVREIVAAVDAHAGNLKAHEAHIGAVGEGVVNKSPIAILIKKPMLDLIKEQIQAKVEESIDALAMTTPDIDQEQLDAQSKNAAALVDGIFRDGTDLAVGVGVGDGGSGLSADFAMDFQPGSEFGDLFNGGGDSAKMLAALPNQPLVFAFAGDYTTPIMKKVLHAVADVDMNLVFAGAADQDVSKLLSQTRGQSFAVYQSAGGLMGGLLANTASYYAADDAGAMFEQIRTLFKGMAGGVEGVSATYKENAAQVDGEPVDTWTVSLAAPADAGAQAGAIIQQVMTMLFGPQGLTGYYAKGAHGVYTTIGAHDALLSACFGAENGQNSLADDGALSKVADHLPEGRSMEMYVGVQSILKQGLQLAAMFGMPLAVDLPDTLPPIGMGVTTDHSAAGVGVFIPASVLKTFGQLAKQTEQMMNQGDAGDKKNAPPF